MQPSTVDGDRSGVGSPAALVCARPPRAAYLSELLRANSSDPATYAVGMVNDIEHLVALLAPRLDGIGWEVVVLDGADRECGRPPGCACQGE